MDINDLDYHVTSIHTLIQNAKYGELKHIYPRLTPLLWSCQERLKNANKFWYIEFTTIEKPESLPDWFRTEDEAELWVHRHFEYKHVKVENGCIYINRELVGGIGYDNLDDVPEALVDDGYDGAMA